MSPAQAIFFLCAVFSLAGLALIFIFVIREGLPIFSKVGLKAFLLGQEWLPTRGSFGALPLILSSLIIVLASVLLASPLGVGLAIYMVEYAPRPVRRWLKIIVELLAGIPSVVFGFFGIVILIPMARGWFGGSGFGLVPAALVLAIMILPTVTAVSADALKAVPRENRLIIYALGGTRWQAVYRGVLPSALRGITTAIILAEGRAIGETMAVLMVLGNAPLMPTKIGQPAAALPSTIALDMAYASGDHRVALFGIGALLLFFSAGLIAAARKVAGAKT
jgi:phosphate transport system permease protein